VAAEEISPGLWHWTARHPRIGHDVSSYYLARERVLIDPLLGEGGFELFAELGEPEHVLMTNRHHDRDAWRVQERFGCEVHCVRAGLHEIEGRGRVSAFEFGDELPGGARALEIDAICPDETALHLPAHRALACADGIVRMQAGGPLGFVPDSLMQEPERTKAGLRQAYRRVLDSGIEPELLLLAHGEPVRADATRALREFFDSD
jgi:hypothetical protein